MGMRKVTTEQLQALRMAMAWPVVVGAAGFLLARLLFWLAFHRVWRVYAVPCAVIGVCAGVVARMISQEWDNGYSYWLWFTVGVFGLAAILLMTAAQLAVDMWRDDDFS